MQQIGYPYHIDSSGQTAKASPEAHIHDLIEQVLFTAPGERVNRPTFGCDLPRSVFAPNNDVLSAATQFTIQGALQQWLGEFIQVEAVEVHSDPQQTERLIILVQYTIRLTQQRQVTQFTREGP